MVKRVLYKKQQRSAACVIIRLPEKHGPEKSVPEAPKVLTQPWGAEFIAAH